MEWNLVLQELSDYHGPEGLNPLTMDTLYGTIWSLRIEYDIPFEKAMAECSDLILELSIRQVQDLLREPDITSTSRPPQRCGIGIGTYGWKYDHEVIHAAVADGCCVIDTAEGYGYGRVETQLGEALKGCGPVDVNTKMQRNRMSPEALFFSVRRSREKLGITPHVQIHYPHHHFPEVMKSLAQLRRRGWIKSVGMGNCSVAQVESSQRMLSEYSGDPVRAVQVRFNLLDQRIKGALLPYCQERGIVVHAYSPLGQKFQDLVRPALEIVAARHEVSAARVALAWLLAHPGVLPLPRSNSIEHTQDNLAATDLILTGQDMIMLEEGYPE